MEKPTKFVLPSPNFEKNIAAKSQPHYLTPSGMTLLPREKQPPPMYGPKGSTVPPKFLKLNAEVKPLEEPIKLPFCEPCEMEFQSVDDFGRHRSQHERCPVDGCKFKGHPNVMDKHVTELHASGIFDKIKKLSTPEEIAAWREERRRKYPTLANAKMRQLAQEQRERRGERLGENKARFGRHEDRKRARANNKRVDDKSEHPKRIRLTENNHKQRQDKQRNASKFQKPAENNKLEKSEDLNKVIEENTAEVVVCGVKMFGGTSTMEDYKHEKTKTEKVKNVLSGLIGMYGSSDEDDVTESDNSDCQIEESKEKTDSTTIELSKIDNCEHEKLEGLNTNQMAIANEQPNRSQQEMKQNDKLIAEKLSNANYCDIEAPKMNTMNEKAETNLSEQGSTVREEIVTTNKTNEQELFTSKSYEVATPVTENPNKESKDVAPMTEITKETTVINPIESSDEEPEEVPIQRTTTLPLDITQASTEATPSSQVETIEAKRLRIEQSRKKLQDRRMYNLNIQRRKLRKQNTMLEKLLEPEIRHERNVLLQCVRFVCENNFFGIGADSTDNGVQTETKTQSTS